MIFKEFYDFDNKITDNLFQVEKDCEIAFKEVNLIKNYNSQKVLKAFSDNHVSDSHLIGTTGYGYNDRGRDNLDRVVAQCFGAEDALVRHNFVSGTHAISTALFGVLRPGDKMVAVAGTPYDTLHGVIGIDKKGDGQGNLKDFLVKYSQIDLKEDGSLDFMAIENSEDVKNAKLIHVQRSRGYSLRPSLTIDVLEKLFKIIRKVNKDCIIFVDNCYGEFVEKKEPTEVGADLMAGSLIKNPGGGIAETGGYVAGNHKLIELVASRLTTPATGREVGSTLGQNKHMYQGFFLSPNVTAEALKTAIFAARLFSNFGYETFPKWDEKRTDIIQAIKVGTKEGLIAFCEGIQKGAPVDSYVTPVPDTIPGYDNEVIMAAGAFNMGASIELSADGPLREPFAVWFQGGVTFATGKIGILLAAQVMEDKKMLFKNKYNKHDIKN